MKDVALLTVMIRLYNHFYLLLNKFILVIFYTQIKSKTVCVKSLEDFSFRKSNMAVLWLKVCKNMFKYLIII